VIVLKEWIKKSLSKGEFLLSIHAISRMHERYVLEADIMACGKTAKTIEFQPDKNTWRVIGKDLDGLKLTIICSLKDNILIVTVY
jgi:hypothetical protein